MNITSVGSGAQEAMETAAQTRAEAAQGDVQARMKLVLMAKMSGVRTPVAAAPSPAASATAASTTTPATTTPDSSASPSVPPPPSGAVLNVKQ